MRAVAGLMRTLRRLPRWAMLPAGVALLTACAFLVWFAASNGDDDSGSRSEQAIAAPTETASPTPVADIDRLIIPAISVDAPVTPRTVDRDGQMPSPDGPRDVIWYDFSALPGLGGRPGASGNTILAGHVDYHGYGPAVFWDLRNVSRATRSPSACATAASTSTPRGRTASWTLPLPRSTRSWRPPPRSR